jgi:hypothetical protein
VAVVGAHDLELELVVDLGPAGAAAAALAFLARVGACRSVIAGDVAQALGRFTEGGGNLDPLAGAGAAVELAGAVLAVLALDRGSGGASQAPA